MKSNFLLLTALAMLSVGQAFAAPVVSNVTAAQRGGTRLVDIDYDLAAVEAVKVTLEISEDDGATFLVPARTLTGAFGLGQTAGVAKRITWNAGEDWNGKSMSSLRFRVTADDRSTGLAFIPDGPFVMGRTSGDTEVNAPPVTVSVSGFSMQTLEVTKAQWDEVRAWGLSNGYPDLAIGFGKQPNHPVYNVTWYAVLKWCNARSEREGLTPCYYLDSAHSTPYRTGIANLTNAMVDPAANGYRLPTEAEWEKAARGGRTGYRFAWGDTINHDHANYRANNTRASYDTSPHSSDTYHPLYNDGSTPYTSPVGSFPANDYGLHDMSGNLWEWCWDWYDENGYAASAGTLDPLGPGSGTLRILRGGSWFFEPQRQRVFRRDRQDPFVTGHSYGFRPVRAGAVAESTSNSVSGATIVHTPLPQVTNLTAQQRPGTKLVDVTYDLTSPLASTVKITLEISSDGGATFTVPVYTLTGAVGLNVTPGMGKQITWDAGADWNGQFSHQMRFRLVADDFSGGMSYIPAGPFVMGRTSGDTASNAPPTTVEVSAFQIAPKEVSKAEWDVVRGWGLLNGYPDLLAGAGKASDHPVQTVTWYAVVKWCNARSEMEGLTPCYYTSSALTNVYRTGASEVQNTWVRWDANGYRLPTEAEWEKASRGGIAGKRFPWGTDIISHAEANFTNSGTRTWAVGTTGAHPLYFVEPSPYTAPCGSFASNAFGLFDVSGNVMEWVWDWYDADHYLTTNGTTNPKGPESSPDGQKVRRGGWYSGDEVFARCGNRFFNTPLFSAVNTGLRVTRSVRAMGLPPGATLSEAVVVNTSSKATQAIDFAVVPQALTTDTVLLSATGGASGLPVSFLVTGGPGVIANGNELTFATAGLVRITASQAGNNDYLPAIPVTREVMVNKAPAQVILGNLVQPPNGTPRTVSVTTVPPGLEVLVNYNGSSVGPVNLGSHPVAAVVDDLIYQGSASGFLHIDHRGGRDPLIPNAITAPPPANDIAWEDAVVGLYDGLLIDANDDHSLLGTIESLRVSRPRPGQVEGGAASGRLRLPGLSAGFSGRFDIDGSLTLNLNRRDGTTVVVTLRLQRTGAGHEVITGSITWNGLNAVARLPRAPFHARQNPAPADWSGAFTLLLPSAPGSGEDEPGGDGWAQVSVSAAGVVKVNGRHGDGTPLLETAYLSEAGECALFAELYRSQPVKGRFGGWLVFRDVPDVSDCDGWMQWVKLADNREQRYANGFDVELPAVGSRFTPPASGERLLAELEDAEPNASLSLIAPNLPASADGEIERVLSWLSSNVLRHYGPETLSGRALRDRGQVNGNYRAADGSVRTSFTGVVLQKQGLAGGQFVWEEQTGALRIVPGTDFPYPGSEDAGAFKQVALPQDQPSPLTLFTRNFEQAAAGSYTGIVRLLDAQQSPSGAIENLSVSKSGAASGTLWLLGQRYALRGQFDVTGLATFIVNRPNLPTIVVTLQLRLAAGTLDGYHLTGTINIGGNEQLVDSQRLPAYTRQTRAPQEGAYTMIVVVSDLADPNDEPGGDGYAVLNVSHLARCTGTLVLADGTKSTFSGHVSRSGEWSFYRPLYGRAALGFVGGKATFRDEPGVGDVDGIWRWFKQGGAPSPLGIYPGGIDTVRQVVGSRYQAPPRGQRAWTLLDDDWHNAWSRLAGPNLSTQVGVTLTEHDRAVSWTSANQLIYHGPEKLSFQFNARTGLVTGRHEDRARGIRHGFGGVLLQKQGFVTGSYQTVNGSGRFWMEKR